MTTRFHHLTPEQQVVVQAAVRQAEAGTSGEIVPMLVPASDDYREAAVQAGAMIAAAAALITGLAVRDTSVWFFLPCAFLLYFPALMLVRRLPRLKLAFTPAGRVDQLVRQRAIRAFHEHGLHRTRRENGILIFISVLERRVWILGDRGINAVIPAQHWITLASGLTAGIRAGRLPEALADTITQVGQLLGQHFPLGSDDTNELPDLLDQKR